MPWGSSGNSPMERLEVVGEGANVVVENNQGYWAELSYLARCCLTVVQVEIGGLGDAWHVMRFYEACLAASEGPVELATPPS